MNNLNILMQPRTTTVNTSKINGVSLGIFTSPVNNDLVELIALFTGNKKTGDMIQLSVLPVDGDIADNTQGRAAICGTCPHVALGSCYAYDQGLFSMMKAFRNGNYKAMELDQFLTIAKTRKIRFGRFGDISLLPFDLINEIAMSCKGFTGYTNQWRSKHYDSRFNELFMLSTLGEKDSKQAAKKFPDARQFKVINTDVDYVNDIDANVITCPSENGFNCNECLLCDGGNAAVSGVNIEIKAHGLDYKSKRINRMLKSDLIAFTAI
jgi:hypothetical protein